jgi:hypothetical protein
MIYWKKLINIKELSLTLLKFEFILFIYPKYLIWQQQALTK